MHRLIITLLLSSISIMSNAINGRLYPSDMMASSSVTGLCQDNHGLIWVATDYGLSRFDGYRFMNYYHVHRDSTSLPDNYVGGVLADSDGNLWIGHGKGLCRYDYATEHFVRKPFPGEMEPRVTTMQQDKEGRVYVGTAGMGLYRMTKDDSRLVRLSDFSDKTNNGFFAHMHIDRRGNLWSGNHKDMLYLFILKDGEMKSHKTFHSSMGEPMSFIDAGEGEILIVCKKGILLYSYATDTLSDAGYDLSVADGLTLHHAFMDRQRNLYLGVVGKGLLVVKAGEKTAKRELLTENHRMQSTSFVSYIMEDRSDNLWLACFDTGLFVASHRKPDFDCWSISAQNPLFAGRLTDVAADGKGGAWCAVRHGMLYHLDREGTLLSSLSVPSDLLTMSRDEDGHYWLGAGNTIYSFDESTLHIRKEHEFGEADIGRVLSDHRGHLYVSLFGKGLYKFDTHTGAVHQCGEGAGMDVVRSRLEWVSEMMIDSRGILWITTATGLLSMNTRNGDFNCFGWDIMLDNISCGPLCETKAHDIVIGTNNGLYIYRRKCNRIDRYPGASSLEDVIIQSILEDVKGNLWVSTSQGLWQYRSDKRRFVHHLSGNGLTAREYVNAAALLFADGRVAFAQRDRLTVFAPSRILQGDSSKAKVSLTRFLCNGNPVDFRSEKFIIPFDKNSFSVELSLLDYDHPDNVSFQYRINEGLWSSTSQGSNVITFGKMKPGTYNIYVRAENSGRVTSDVLTFEVHVLHPWYMSTWALLIYLVLASAIVWYVVRSYTHRKRRELDEEKMKFLINATHDIRSPLTLIMGPLAKLKDIVDDEKGRGYIEVIDRNAQRLLLLVNQILDERRIDKKQMQLHCRETNLVEFITAICKLYQYNASQRSITFTFEHDREHLLAWVDRINFDKVICNLLSNAFKYTYDGGEVKVVLQGLEREVSIQFIDSGVGIKPEDKDRIFDRFYQSANVDSLGMQGTGIGLDLCRNIVKMHGGTIKADNRKDGEHGACFTVSLPLGNAHLQPEQIVTESPSREVLSKGADRRSVSKSQILIADDDSEIADYIIAELGQWYKFDHAPNGKEALKKLFAGHYDLVISDVMMPELDGISLLKRIKSNPTLSELPVIMLTSKAAVENKLEGLKSGADAYIAKPFSMDELHIQMDNLLDNVRRLRGKFSGALQQAERVENIEVKGYDDSLMERIMQSVNAHMDDPDFGVDALASDVGLSRGHLHRKIKEMTGVSTGRFLRNLRMEQAARLLLEGKVNVSEVADRVGYIDQTHFSQAFKNHFGISPSAYKDSQNE